MTKLKILRDCYMSDGRNMEQKIKEEMVNHKCSDGIGDCECSKCVFINKFLNITDEKKE